MIPATNPTRPVEIFSWTTIPGTHDTTGWVPPRRERTSLGTAKCLGFAQCGDSTEMDVVALIELPDGTVTTHAVRDIKFLDVDDILKLIPNAQ